MGGGLTPGENFASLGGFSPGVLGFYQDDDVDRQLTSQEARELFRIDARNSLTGPTGVQRVRIYDRDAEMHGNPVREHIVVSPWTHAKVAGALLRAWSHHCYFCYWTPAGWEYSDRAKCLVPKRVQDALLVTSGSCVVALPVCPECKVTLQGEVASDNPDALGFDFLSDRHSKS